MCLSCYKLLFTSKFIIKKSKKPISKTQLKPSKVAIRKVSKKLEEKNKEYFKLRKILLKKYPKCQVCNINLSTECHHPQGRGERLLDGLICICRDCHNRVHSEKEWAKSKGLLISRIKI